MEIAVFWTCYSLILVGAFPVEVYCHNVSSVQCSLNGAWLKVLILKLS